MNAPALNPRAPLPSLLRSLARAGWGQLGTGRDTQRLRTTLQALSMVLPDKSAQGQTTAYQLAEAGGCSDKTIRRALAELEDLEIIEIVRGGIIKGKPAPSFIKVVKTKLVELIRSARNLARRARAAHRERTDERLSKLDNDAPKFRPRETPTRFTRHVDTKSSPLSSIEGGAQRAHSSGELDSLMKNEHGAAVPDLFTSALASREVGGLTHVGRGFERRTAARTLSPDEKLIREAERKAREKAQRVVPNYLLTEEEKAPRLSAMNAARNAAMSMRSALRRRRG